MLSRRPLGVSLLALSLFLALAVPALADSGVYGTVDTGTGSTGTTRDTPLLLPPATSPAAAAFAHLQRYGWVTVAAPSPPAS